MPEDVFWLNFVNLALALVTLLLTLLVAGGVVYEIRHRRSRGEQRADDHAFETPELGLTMADGGKRIDRP